MTSFKRSECFAIVVVTMAANCNKDDESPAMQTIGLIGL